MEKWLKNWYTKYDKLKKSIENNKLNDQLYEELAKECGQLLEKWMEMEDKLEDIKEFNDTKPQLNVVASFQELRGPTYFHLDMFDKAIKELKLEIGKEKKHELLLYLYLGFAYLYEGRLVEAKETFLYVTQTTLNTIEKHFSYVGIACLYGRNHQYEEAIHFFEKANLLYNNKDVTYNIGMAFLMLNKCELAIPYLKKIVENNEDDGEAMYFLGSCYLKSGDEAKAFESWYAALQLVESKDLLISLAYEFELYGYYSAAIHCYKRLETLGHMEDWVYHGLAWNYGLLEKKDDAIALFQQLIQKDGADINIYISYLWLLNRWNEKERQERLLREINEQQRNHPLIDKILQRKI